MATPPTLSFRPTRRDLLLCLLTLSFSYFLFSSTSSSPYSSEISSIEPVQVIGYSRPAATLPKPDSIGSSGAGSRYIPSWLWPGSSSSNRKCIQEEVKEESFGESVKTYGTTRPGSPGIVEDEGGVWDQGNEEFPIADPNDHPAADSALTATPALGLLGDSLAGLMTDLRGHQPGWTLMDRAYVFNGSLYVVTDNRTAWPELIHMTSTGLPANNDPGNAEARRPTGKEIIFISPAEAADLWGSRVMKMGGTTWMFNDGQFIDHYYHFSAELLLGTWRVYASLDPDITAKGETRLPPPRRAWFLHQNAKEWRDRPKFNPTVLFAAFPSISLLYPEDWTDFTSLTNSTTRPRAFMLERVLLADRSSAFYGPYTAPTSRTVASALWVGEASRWWWEPIRRQLLRYSGVSESIINRNLEGKGAIDPVFFDPKAEPKHSHPIGQNPLGNESVTGGVETTHVKGDYKPVITYISRQGSRRRLANESHEDLVRHLEERRDKLGYELNVVEAERLSREEQIALAGKTTIMLGVHGNGLTHLLWMPATPQSAVIEMYFRGGFARDYQWTAHALGMRHFGVNHDVTFTAPDLPEVLYPEGFHGTEITVDGKTVADLIEERLAGRI